MLGLFLPWDFALAVSCASTSPPHTSAKPYNLTSSGVMKKFVFSWRLLEKHPSTLFPFLALSFFFSHYVYLTNMCCAVLSHFSCVRLFANPWTVAHQAPLPMGVIQARILEWVTMVLRGIFPTQGSNSGLPHWRWVLYHLNHQESPRILKRIA